MSRIRGRLDEDEAGSGAKEEAMSLRHSEGRREGGARGENNRLEAGRAARRQRQRPRACAA